MRLNKNSQKSFQVYFFFAFFFAATVAMVMLFWPFLAVLTIGAILAVVLYPWYQRLVLICGGHRSPAALLLIILFLVVVIIPLGIVGRQIFNESLSVYQQISTASWFELRQLPPAVQDSLAIFFPDFSLELGTFAKTLSNWLIGNLGHIFSSTIEIVVSIFLVLISLYFFLKDGERFKSWLIKLSPLEDRYDNSIFTDLHQTIHAVVVGTLAIAIVQGILVGAGFLVFGLSNGMLWGSVAAISAVLPGLGTGLVTIPAVVYLFFTGNVVGAVGLAIWSVVLVGLIDNILLPYFYSRGSHVHPLLILFSVLGGLVLFGPVGFLLGPIILSVFLTLVQIYQLLIAARGGIRERLAVRGKK